MSSSQPANSHVIRRITNNTYFMSYQKRGKMDKKQRTKFIEAFFKANPDKWLIFEYWKTAINESLPKYLRMTTPEFSHEVKKIRYIKVKYIENYEREIFYKYEVE